MALVHAAVMGVFYCCFIIIVVVVTMTIMIIRIIFVAVPVINDIVIILCYFYFVCYSRSTFIACCMIYQPAVPLSLGVVFFTKIFLFLFAFTRFRIFARQFIPM